VSVVAAGLSRRLAILIAVACGLIVANIYVAQPLAGPIAASVGLSAGAAGLVVTLTQIGYGAGLLLVVPLADRIENRRLVLSVMAAATLALLCACVASSAWSLLAASLLIGVGSVAVQVLVPYAAHLAPEQVRGRTVGNVMSGLMLGIMLSRPVSSLIASLSSWRVVFAVCAAIMVALGLVLRAAMPPRSPPPGPSYPALLASMAGLMRHTDVLRRRAAYHACLFAGFSLFWTVAPLLLAQRFHLGQRGIALFALVGVAGAVSAPLAGRAADRGWTRPATLLAMLGVAVAFLAMLGAGSGSTRALLLLGAGAVLLDFCVTANLVLGQRAIYALGAELRGRLNGLYMASFFGGGAIGSAVGGWLYDEAGWGWACGLGLGFPLLALLCFATESQTKTRR
jgi:predicted MFS family arabinose efflux permease